MSDLLNVRGAAEYLGLSAKAVYDLISAEILPCRRLGVKGGKIVLEKADVEAYWESCKSRREATTPEADSGPTLRHLRI